MFYVCIAFCVLGLLVFSFLSHTEVQVWAIEEGFNQSLIIDKAGDVQTTSNGEDIEINENGSEIKAKINEKGQT